MMKPTNGKTARNHVLPEPRREKRGSEDNAGFDEILLSPHRLTELSHRGALSTEHLNSPEDKQRRKIQRVRPARDEENSLKSNSDCGLEGGDEQNQLGKLPPVKLQRVLSEDLSWLDTIIHSTNTASVKQQQGDNSVRSDSKIRF